MFNTPVALIIFRRPALTERVLKALSVVKPRKLLIIADGPRNDRPGEAEACAAARAAAERVTWECDIVRNYSDINLGCGRRPATGISWVFQQVEEAIILEDDCVPDPSFFPYCEELLSRYRDDERVMHINGSTYRHREFSVPHSYYFSQFIGCWGWATWRRAWRHYDFAVKAWPQFRQSGWLDVLLENNEHAIAYWRDKFDRAHASQPGLSFWDYQWAHACWTNSGLGIIPSQNLVSNVGCEQDATHTFDHPMGNVPSRALSFPLTHPPTVLHDWKLDRDFFREVLLPTMLPPQVSPLIRARRAVSRVTPEFAKQMYRVAVGRPRVPTA
jgi:hypothetical protein